VRPGTILHIGPVQLQVTRFAAPCRKIRGAFLKSDYMRLSQEQHPGFSRVCARVLAGGIVRAGDAVAIAAEKG
jgi:MOSC domain-containing protein YiiM